MERVFNKILKILLISFVLLLGISSTNKIFAAYTDDLNVGDKLKFVGKSWYVYKTEEAAQDLDTSKANGYLKPDDQITIEKITGNVLKIGENKFIRYGSTAKNNFTKVSSDTGPAQASIGEKQYKTLQEAINAVPKDNSKTTVKLLVDVSNNQAITIAEKQNVVLDLNGHTIKATGENYAIENKGVLELNGNGKIQGEANGLSTVRNRGTLTIGKTTITAKNDCAINNSGTAVVKNDAKISNESNKSSTIYNCKEGKLTIEGGEITSKNSCALSNSGTAKISGNAKISNESNYHSTIYNEKEGTLTIEGGEITSKYYNAAHNIGTVTISGNAKISNESNNHSTIYNAKEGTLTIEGGEIISKDSNALKNAGTVTISGNAKISNESDGKVAVNNCEGATLIIEGGKITARNKHKIENAGEVEVNTEEVKKSDIKNIDNGKVDVLKTNNNTDKPKSSIVLLLRIIAKILFG